MTYKLTCPGCLRYLSSIFRAYEDGRPCPQCGASLQGAEGQFERQLPRDSDTCSMGDETPCSHGVRAGRYCSQCDRDGMFAAIDRIFW